MRRGPAATWAIAILLAAGGARAESLLFEDPEGDDFGPGRFVYPTDAVYTRGSFDLRRLEIRDLGRWVELRITLAADIDDPWHSAAWSPPGRGFSLQLVQVYLDTGAGGTTRALPGIRGRFAEDEAWDRVVLIAPQARPAVATAIEQAAPDLASVVLVPSWLRVRGPTLVVRVPRRKIGSRPDSSWGVQVVVQSSDPAAAGAGLLVRGVNALAGRHRFGGADARGCEPWILDLLAPPGRGEAPEVDAQMQVLRSGCAAGVDPHDGTVLPMVRTEP